jgi:hypothetical protein
METNINIIYITYINYYIQNKDTIYIVYTLLNFPLSPILY